MKKQTLLIVMIVSIFTTVSAKDPVPNKNYTKSLHDIILTVGNVQKTQYFVSSTVYLTENGRPYSIKYYRHGDFDQIDSRIMIGTGQRGVISRMDSTAAIEDEGGIIPATYTIYVNFKKTNKKRDKAMIEVPFVYSIELDAYVIKSSFKIDSNTYTTECSAVLQISSELVKALKSVGDIKIKNKNAPRR